MNHTPTPLETDGTAVEWPISLGAIGITNKQDRQMVLVPVWFDDNTGEEAWASARAFATFIVEACNAHDRLKQWVDDLQSRMFVNCVYCGHRYGPQHRTPITMADVLKQHIEQCPEHPMSTLKKQRDMLLAAAQSLTDHRYKGIDIRLDVEDLEKALALCEGKKAP